MQGVTTSDIPLHGRVCGNAIVELRVVLSAMFITICLFHSLIALEASVVLVKILVLSCVSGPVCYTSVY